MNDLVHEDEAIAKILTARDLDALMPLIRERDATYSAWDFKFPMPCRYLYGWRCLTAVAEPAALDLLVDDQPVLAFLADVFRQDLLDAGFGTGDHGFSIDLARLGLRPDSVIRIRVVAQGIELDNSGHRLDAYGG
jgi:hypothetical protein